ncbi:phenylacetic acid degradation operon negative regulatory protein PaaX [candidate division WOR-3 bacterium]|nr:phenylacetic acid degradation operon negative regulatory protein PaaX [candidate division WOR-3 bacterium]
MSQKIRNIKLKHKSKTIRTTTIIFTLFGGYINPRGGEIRAGNLIKLLTPFGLSGNAIRLALSRMSKQGLIRSRKKGRESYYSLTKKGNDLMLGGKHWALEKEYKPWDKKWRLVVYSIPEEMRHVRDTLRKKLRSIGFGSLSSSMWISPYDFKKELASLFKKLEVTKYVETFEAKYTGQREGQKIAAKGWSIHALENRYKEFLNKYSPLLSMLKEKIKKKKVIDSGECFAQRFRVTAEFIDIALDDPMLPLELLPDNWVGLKAKKICLEYWKFLTPEVNKFVDSILKDGKSKGNQVKR